MTPDPDRLAFLRAIASSPDDDTPRLVFADWLDEHAASDADRARAEFLRLSCRSRPKARITKAEQDWLAENWRRLVPTTSARLTELGAKPDGYQWKGRRLELFAFESYRRRDNPLQVNFTLEFWRGFVREAEYTFGFDEVAAAVVADEPLARHGFKSGALPDVRNAGFGYRLGITLAFCFGRVVWDRLAGFDEVGEAGPGNPVKWYEHPGREPGARKELYRRVHDAVAAAMTARARELAGWPADLPTLGG
jgi:uncharacterized protein (TIGR02996 family)